MLIAPRSPPAVLPSSGGTEHAGDAIVLQVLERLRAQRRREVDQIVGSFTNGRPYAGGLVGNGCVGDVFSPGTSDCGTGFSSIGQIG